MFHYVVVDGISGEIKYPAYGTSESCFHRDGCLVIKIDKYLDNHTDYFFNLRTGKIEKRPSFNILLNKPSIKADSTEQAIISNIPRGTTCLYDDQASVVDDSLIEFTAEHPGEYVFEFSMFPYIPTTITVETK